VPLVAMVLQVGARISELRCLNVNLAHNMHYCFWSFLRRFM